MSAYFRAPDGDGEDSLWRNTANPDYPTQVLRECELPISARHLWPTIVGAVTSTDADIVLARIKWLADELATWNPGHGDYAGAARMLRDALEGTP